VTAFILLAALMALAAGGLVAWPLLRHGTPSRALGAAFIVVLPLVAGLCYYATQSGDFWRQPDEPAADGVHPSAMVAALEAKLREKPDDPAGWILLGRSYQVMEDYPRSATAYERAVKLTGSNNVDALIGLGVALAATDEASITGRAGQLFERSLELAPEDPRALWYGGFASFRRGDVETTRARWQKLSTFDLPVEIRKELERALAGIGVAPGAAAGTAPPSRAAESGPSLRVRVDLSPALKGSVPAQGTLFVFLRESGQGPPLAVVRRPAESWPAEVSLSQADVMLPGRRLDQLAGAHLVARVSLSGEPRASSGDLYGEARVPGDAGQGVAVLIDSKVP